MDGTVVNAVTDNPATNFNLKLSINQMLPMITELRLCTLRLFLTGVCILVDLHLILSEPGLGRLFKCIGTYTVASPCRVLNLLGFSYKESRENLYKKKRRYNTREELSLCR